MKYYSIGRTNEIEVIGYYPQTSRTSQAGFHVDAFNSEDKVKPDEFPDFEPNFGLDIHPNAIETDILDSAACLSFGMVISEKLKLILDEYNLPPHRFYPIKVFNASTQYFWFHYITEFEKFIDLENTVIERFDLFKFTVLEILRFQNYKDLISEKKKSILEMGKPLRYKSVGLKDNFPDYDLFEIKGAQYLTLINQSLKERLDNENISGIEYLEYDKLTNYP